MHVKGLTMTHPGIPDDIRGTYAAIGHPAIIDHLKGLGVTAVELLPVHQFVNDSHLVEQGPVQLLGLQHDRLPGPAQRLLQRRARAVSRPPSSRAWCKALHEANIEVILDVVYNHTAEGNERGPTIAFRGIDNASYYRLVDSDKSHYYDTTGTGNSLLMRSPHVLQLIMDSLRYWVQEMHVDGFRFDLAADAGPAVPRGRQAVGLLRHHPAGSGDLPGEADRRAVGPRRRRLPGRQLPAAVDGVERQVPRHRARLLARRAGERWREFASRLTGSSDLYNHSDRRPTASINFVIAHDGFTLRDLVSYNEKHNEANGEGGNDGESHNRSWNCGVEGPTDDPRRSTRCGCGSSGTSSPRLMLSQGVPMLAHGDELGRTQNGNNNVYAQDNEISWVDWDLDPDQKEPAGLHVGGDRAAQARIRCSAAGASSPATPRTAASSELGRHRVVQARTARGWTTATGTPASPAA